MVDWVHKSTVCGGVAWSVLVGIVVGYKELLVEGRPFVASLLRALRHLDGWRCHVFIGHLAENVAQAIQAGAALVIGLHGEPWGCLLYTSPSPRDRSLSRMPSSA